jgi:hypothetical protein
MKTIELDRLDPFVSGLGKAILQELKEELAAQQEPAGEPVAARVVRRIIPAGHGTPEKSTYDVQWIGVDPYKFAGDLFTRPAVPLSDEKIGRTV